MDCPHATCTFWAKLRPFSLQRVWTATAAGCPIDHFWTAAGAPCLTVEGLTCGPTVTERFHVADAEDMPLLMGWSRSVAVELGLGRMIALYTTVRPLYTRFVMRFGASFSDATVRPEPRSSTA